MAGPPNSDTPHGGAKDQRIAELIDQYLQIRRSTGRSPDEIRLELVNANGDIPELSELLLVAEMALSAWSKKDLKKTPAGEATHDSESPTLPLSNRNRLQVAEKVMRLTCGHCGNKLRIVAPLAEELSCPSCGSVIKAEKTVSRTDPIAGFPRTIGRFSILSRLGSGAFGHAYRAFDPHLAREVAIKVPRAGTFSSDLERERFVREAKSAARLRHPNIVQVHEVSVDGETPYLVCDLVNGVTLSDLIGSRRLPFRTSAEMMVDIALAVQFAHDNNIIHRDIKPGNILLDENHKPFIADFGLARDIATEVTMTATGEILGTPAYMSPEQARGESSLLTYTSDVYSLGVVFYRMLCGELPFRGSQRMLLNQVLYDDPKPPCRVNDAIPRDLDTIVMKAMAKEPAKRYPTAREFADDLRRWMNDESIVARPDGKLTRLVRWKRRHPAVARLAMGIAGLLVLVAALSTAWAINANWLNGIAQRNAVIAKEHETESTRRLAKSHLQNGNVLMESGHHGQALLWLGSALSLGGSDEVLQRTRIGMLWQQLPYLRSIVASPREISAMAASKDGTRIVVGCPDGSILVFEKPNVVAPAYSFNQGSRVRSIQLGGSDEKMLLTTGIDDTPRLWNLATGETIARLEHEKGVRNAAFSPDGRWIATAGLNGLARLWNADTGELEKELAHEQNELGHLRFSPDSSRLVVSSRANVSSPCRLSVWKLEGESPQLEREIQSAGITLTLGFSRDGKQLVAGSFVASPDENHVETWNLAAENDQAIGEIAVTTRSDCSHAWFLESDAKLLTVESNGDISLWSFDGKQQTSTSHPTSITDASVDRDQQFLLVSGTDGNSVLYWLKTLEPVSGAIPNGDSANHAQFLDDGRHVVIGGEHGVVRTWDLAGLARHHLQLPHSDSVQDVQIDSTNQTVLTACADGTVRRWNAVTGEPDGAVITHPSTVYAARYKRDGNTVVTACADNAVRAWDIRTGKLIAKPIEHPVAAHRCEISNDDELIVSASSDGSVILSRRPHEEPLFQFSHSGLVYGLAFSPDNQLLATGSVDKTVRLWSTSDGLPAGAAIRHESPVGEISFTRDGKTLATACQDDLIRMWSIPDLTLERSLKLSGFPTAIEFLPDGRQLLTADENGLVTLWSNEGDQFRLEHQVGMPDYYLTHARYCNKPKMVLGFGSSSAMSGTRVLGSGAVFLIDMESESLLGPPLRHCSNVNHAEISGDGRFIVSGSQDGTALIWHIVQDDSNPDSMMAKASLYCGWRLKNQSKQVSLSGSETRALLDEIPDNTVFQASDSNSLLRWNSFVDWLKSKCLPTNPGE